MWLVTGGIPRLRLLAACFVAVFLYGVGAFAAETLQPATLIDTPAAPTVAASGTAPADASKDASAPAKAEAEKKDPPASAEAAPVPPPPTPTAEEIAKREKRAEQYKALAEGFFKFPVSGSLTTRYQMRTGDMEGANFPGAITLTKNARGVVTRASQPTLPPLGIVNQHDRTTDQDLYQYLTVDIGDHSKHPVVAHFDVQVDEDLDGYKNRVDVFVTRGTTKGFPITNTFLVDRRDPFLSIDDTFHASPAYARLYSAYLDFTKIPGVEVLRVGRQYTYETPETTRFDGGRLDTKPYFGDQELVFSFYGGRTVHDYELTQADHVDSVLHDLTYGAAAEGRPWDGGRLRMDWQHLDDQFWDEYKYPDSGFASNDELTWNLWQVWHHPNVKVQGSFSLLDGTAHTAFGRVIYDKPDWKLTVCATYRAYINRTIERLALELDPMVDTLGELHAYHSGSLVVTKGWTDHFQTEVGASAQRLFEGPDTAYNRNFDRYFATLRLTDLPKGFTFSVTGSKWQGKGRGANTNDLTGDVSYDWNKIFKTSVGSDFSLYRYDMPVLAEVTGDTLNELTTRVERDSVRTYYVRQCFRPTRWAKLDVGYEFEHSRTNKFHTFSATFRFDF